MSHYHDDADKAGLQDLSFENTLSSHADDFGDMLGGCWDYTPPVFADMDVSTALEHMEAPGPFQNLTFTGAEKNASPVQHAVHSPTLNPQQQQQQLRQSMDQQFLQMQHLQNQQHMGHAHLGMRKSGPFAATPHPRSPPHHEAEKTQPV